MKIYDTPRQARSLREIEDNALKTAKLTEIDGILQPVSAPGEEDTPGEEIKEIVKKNRKKKDSKDV